MLRRFSAQHFDDRNQKRKGLAGARLGGANYVLAFEGRSDGARLDGCEGNKLSCRQLLLQVSRQGQFCKCCHSFVFFLEGLDLNFLRPVMSHVETSHAARIKLALEPNGGQEMRKWCGSNRIPA
jgi:hypothetical protein